MPPAISISWGSPAVIVPFTHQPTMCRRRGRTSWSRWGAPSPTRSVKSPNAGRALSNSSILVITARLIILLPRLIVGARLRLRIGRIAVVTLILLLRILLRLVGLRAEQPAGGGRRKAPVGGGAA